MEEGFVSCHILDGDRLLLKKATRGISRGKWNCPGGCMEPGESPEDAARREVYEETGLRINELFYHGQLHLHYTGQDVLMHLFSTRNFDGTPRSSEEGEVRWFGTDRIPYKEMWSDDIFWIDLMLKGMRFDATFYFDRANRVIKHSIEIID